VATPRGIESLRIPRRYWGAQVGVVAIPVSDEEVRGAELQAPIDAGAWPRVVTRPDLLAPALSRLMGGDHTELSLQPARDGLKATLLTPADEEQRSPWRPRMPWVSLRRCSSTHPGGGQDGGGKSTARPSERTAGGAAARIPRAHCRRRGGGPTRHAGRYRALSGRPRAVAGEPGAPGRNPSGVRRARDGTFDDPRPPGAHPGVARRGRWPDRPARPRDASRAPVAGGGAERLAVSRKSHAAAPDFVLIEHLEGTSDLLLAARLASSGCLVLAGAPAADPEALAKSVAREIAAGAAPDVPVTVLAQTIVRTPCRGCLGWIALPRRRCDDSDSITATWRRSSARAAWRWRADGLRRLRAHRSGRTDRSAGIHRSGEGDAVPAASARGGLAQGGPGSRPRGRCHDRLGAQRATASRCSEDRVARGLSGGRSSPGGETLDHLAPALLAQTRQDSVPFSGSVNSCTPVSPAAPVRAQSAQPVPRATARPPLRSISSTSR